MKMSTAFPSKYLKAADLQDRQHTLTMKLVEFEIIGDDDRKPVLYFERTSKGLVLNKTNAKVISAAYGDESELWHDKPLILFPAVVDFRGDQVEAIRVRVPKPATTAVLGQQSQATAIQHVDPEPPPHDGGLGSDTEIPF
jgi:hypothetical protein